MDDYELVIKSCKRLEEMLAKGFGAEGRGLHERVNSVENQLPIPLIKKLRFVATVRNRLVHDASFERLDDRDSFERASEECEQQIRKLLTPAAKPRKRQLVAVIAISAIILFLLLIAFFATR